MSNEDSSRRIEFVVSGKVQRVFFRVTTIEQAKQLGLTGWVKNVREINRTTGSVVSETVKGEAQGSSLKLDGFIKYLHKGPEGADVSNVNVNDIPLQDGSTGFEKANTEILHAKA